VLSIEGNLIVLLKLALNCKLWTESNLPSLNGIKAIDNRVYTVGTERSRYVINTRPSRNLQTSRRHIICSNNHIAPGPSSKQQAA